MPILASGADIMFCAIDGIASSHESNPGMRFSSGSRGRGDLPRPPSLLTLQSISCQMLDREVQHCSVRSPVGARSWFRSPEMKMRFTPESGPNQPVQTQALQKVAPPI